MHFLFSVGWHCKSANVLHNMTHKYSYSVKLSHCKARFKCKYLFCPLSITILVSVLAVLMGAQTIQTFVLISICIMVLHVYKDLMMKNKAGDIFYLMYVQIKIKIKAGTKMIWLTNKPQFLCRLLSHSSPVELT